VSIVFVTGGARRIGRALVERFCSAENQVFFTYNSSQSQADELVIELSGKGLNVSATHCEVSNPQSIIDAIGKCTSTYGLPNVVVSSAGIFPEPVHVNQLDVEALISTMNVNTFPLLTIAAEYMRLVQEAQTHGRLIAITSVGAFETWKNRTEYNVSKSAQHALMLSLARNCAPHLSVNAVAPGAIVFTTDPTVADESAGSIASIPMGRYGVGNDVADAVTFFAECTSYITGQTLTVDGGYLLTR